MRPARFFTQRPHGALTLEISDAQRFHPRRSARHCLRESPFPEYLRQERIQWPDDYSGRRVKAKR